LLFLKLAGNLSSMNSKLEFSAKITHSVCLSLESMGIVHGDFLEEVGLTPEKAFDPEAWIDAETLEKFLSYISYKIPTLSLKSIALEEFNLNGWGVLNQVSKLSVLFCKTTKCLYVD